MEALLEARRLGFQVSDPGEPSVRRSILEGIDFAMAKGETLAVTGPSGSGKSTLLQLLCRILEPSSGMVFYLGKSFDQIPPRQLRREVTLVFQTPSLLGPQVKHDWALGEKFAPIPHPNGSAELLEGLHLTPDILEKTPAQLSLGEAQRIALGRALMIEPKVLLLDEPTASLDMESKLGIEETLRNKVKAGLTVAIVSHEERQVQDLAHHGIRLEQGRLVKSW